MLGVGKSICGVVGWAVKVVHGGSSCAGLTPFLKDFTVSLLMLHTRREQSFEALIEDRFHQYS